MKQRKTSWRQGFTVVEILIVVMILALLMAGVAYMVLRPQEQAKIRQTRMAMETLKSMVEELRLANDLQSFYPSQTDLARYPYQIDVSANPLVLPEDTAQWNTYPAVLRTQWLMQKLMAMPSNKQAMARLPAEMFKTFGASPAPVAVDGWGSPIIYVPADGVVVRTATNQVMRVTSAGTVVPAAATPMGAKGFWMSAGPDRNFQTGKDNVCSFEN
jgi:prepilin-type N-terminal cleavage/methylation domain-containing protein